MAKKSTAGDDRMVAVEEALGKTEQFVEKNQKLLMYAIMGVIIVVLVYFGYQKFYISPMEKNAQDQIFMAQKYFEMDSLSRALYGDGNALGFLDIIDDYGRTKSGNLAKYYAGICYLRMGNFEEAIDYLESHDPVDQNIGPMAIGAIGDAYMELNEPDRAVDYYLEAANDVDNDFTSPMFLYKAGMTYEMLGAYEDAYDAYNRIFMDYYKSVEARSIERNIARMKAMMEKE
ncbi:MAG: tetratricopeptide repeat protein [Bacteroidetes bacterium]|nr:tetratricopeptide repeat protein [Bacteroidota bacterium]MCK5766270.1 tetratricopeptide repeat protein [Bacteroidales bacterium]